MEPQRSQIFSFQTGCSLKNIAGYDIHLIHFCRSKVGPNHKSQIYIIHQKPTLHVYMDYTVTAGCNLSFLLLFLTVIFSFSFSFLTLFPSHCLQKTAKSCCTYRTGSPTLFFQNFKETPLSRKMQRIK